jgi:hypothetical protein
MKKLLGIAVLLLALAPAAQADPFRVRLKPHSTVVIRSQVLPADKGLDVTAYVAGRALREGLTDGGLAFALHGHGVAVIFHAKARRARANIELANFRSHAVRVLVRVRPVPLLVIAPEPIEPDPIERVCADLEDSNCIDPNDEALP